jgi:hypothetical protein
MRDEQLSNDEKQKMSYYLTAATPQQIKDLIASDPDKAKAWGLVPSDEVKNALSLSALKQKYPNAREEDLAQYISILLDENGNYRSQIYQKQMGSLTDLDPNSASMNTLTGLSTNKEQFQRGEALRKELLKEEEAYKEFTTPDVAFLRNSDPGAFENVTGTKQKSPTESFNSIIKKAGASITPPTPVKSPSGNTIQTSSKSEPSSALKNMSIANSPKTTTTTSSGTKPTPSQLSAMAAQVASMQKTVAGLAAAKSGSTSAPKISTPTSTSKSSATSSVSSKTSAADRARATRLARGAKR